jgi:hypothetical protein
VAVGCFALILPGLTWAVLGNGNPGYATFKLASWVGPALLIAGWRLTGVVSRSPRRWLSFGLLLLASYRTLGFVWSAASLTVAFWPTSPPSTVWRVSRAPTSCTLELVQTEPNALSIETAVAESAAPRLGCGYSTGSTGGDRDHEQIGLEQGGPDVQQARRS